MVVRIEKKNCKDQQNFCLDFFDRLFKIEHIKQLFMKTKNLKKVPSPYEKNAHTMNQFFLHNYLVIISNILFCILFKTFSDYISSDHF